MEAALILHKAVGIILLGIGTLLSVEIVGKVILLEQVILEVFAELFSLI